MIGMSKNEIQAFFSLGNALGKMTDKELASPQGKMMQASWQELAKMYEHHWQDVNDKVNAECTPDQRKSAVMMALKVIASMVAEIKKTKEDCRDEESALAIIVHELTPLLSNASSNI